MWLNPYGTHLIMGGYQSHKITTLTFILREIKQIVSFINILLSPEQNYMCLENKMTNNGPMWAPYGLKFQYRTDIGPFWALCPDSAHMGPICPCLLGGQLTTDAKLDSLPIIPSSTRVFQMNLLTWVQACGTIIQVKL